VPGSLGAALNWAQQIQQVQQVQAMQQALTTQWVQMLLNQGYTQQQLQDPAMQAQIHAQVNQSLQQQGVNVGMLRQLQAQMAA
jgi:hypothetical protein